MITFIIPSIGRETLSRTLQSLYSQTIANWKAIVVFDGIKNNLSTSITDERVTIYEIEKKGEDLNSAGNVRNYAIEKCDTEWVAFVDDDDTISNNYIELFNKELELCPELDTIIFRMNYLNNIIPPLSYKDIIKNHVGISFAMKKQIFDNGIIFIPSKVEDFLILDKIKNKNYKMCISPYICYFVRDKPIQSEDLFNENNRTYMNLNR